jgi:serine protease Do
VSLVSGQDVQTAKPLVAPEPGKITGAESRTGGGFERAIEAVLPRVVKLYGLGVGMQAGYGTGVLVSADGLVLTVFSLLIDARRVRAVTSDGAAFEADVVHRDETRQLALLRLKRAPRAGPMGDDRNSPPPGSASDIGPVPFFDFATEGLGTTLSRGDWVLAAGNPFKVADGAEPMSLAHGVFSARIRLDARRQVKAFPYRGDVLVIDAITSNPGAPGSAVVDLEGNFVGMVGRVVVSNLTHTQFNYAIPRDVLFDFFQEATHGAPSGTLSPTPSFAENAAESSETKRSPDPGIKIARAGYQRVPPFVERVRPDSPADRAGVRKDDLILSINGRNVTDVEQCDERLRGLSAYEPIDLVIRRGREIIAVRVEGAIR